MNGKMEADSTNCGSVVKMEDMGEMKKLVTLELLIVMLAEQEQGGEQAQRAKEQASKMDKQITQTREMRRKMSTQSGIDEQACQLRVAERQYDSLEGGRTSIH